MRLQEFLHGATSHKVEPADTTGQVIGVTPAKRSGRQPVRFAAPGNGTPYREGPHDSTAYPSRERTHIS